MQIRDASAPRRRPSCPDADSARFCFRMKEAHTDNCGNVTNLAGPTSTARKTADSTIEEKRATKEIVPSGHIAGQVGLHGRLWHDPGRANLHVGLSTLGRGVLNFGPPCLEVDLTSVRYDTATAFVMHGMECHLWINGNPQGTERAQRPECPRFCGA